MYQIMSITALFPNKSITENPRGAQPQVLEVSMKDIVNPFRRDNALLLAKLNRSRTLADHADVLHPLASRRPMTIAGR